MEEWFHMVETRLRKQSSFLRFLFSAQLFLGSIHAILKFDGVQRVR